MIHNLFPLPIQLNVNLELGLSLQLIHMKKCIDC